MPIGKYISIITLNVNGLNAPIKRHRWLNAYKNKTHIYAVYKKPTSDSQVRGWKKIFHTNGNQKKSGVAIVISDKIDNYKEYYKR